MLSLVACVLGLKVALSQCESRGHLVRIEKSHIQQKGVAGSVNLIAAETHRHMHSVVGSASSMAVASKHGNQEDKGSMMPSAKSRIHQGKDPGHAEQQNPCSIIGCNSHNCGFVMKVVEMKSCRNSKLLGRKDLKEQSNSTEGVVKVENLRDCMHAVRHMTDCSPFFEVHSETLECSCVPIGIDCEEADDHKSCRYQINEFGPAARRYVSPDLSWFVNVLLITAIVVAQVWYIVGGRVFKRDATPEKAQLTPIVSGHESALQLDIAPDSSAPANLCAPTGSPPPVTTSVYVAGVASTEASILKKRMVFLDNLKVFLTCSVVFHHILCAYGLDTTFLYNIVVLSDGLACRSPESDECKEANITSRSIFKWAFSDFVITMDTSYFMSLFFFMSGYFSPSSLDRKGCGGFIQDKVKRLGLPAVWWYLLGGPLWTYFILAGIGAATTAGGFTYGQNGLWCVTGPPWFNLFLLVFSVLYAVGHGNPLRTGLPSITTFLGVGFSLGMLRSIVPKNAFVLGVPGGLNSLIFYIPAFWIGSVAKRNRWLDELFNLKKEQIWLLRILTLVLLAVQWMGNYLGSQRPSVTDYGAAMTVLQGVFCVSVSLVLLDLFHRYLNNGSMLASCLSDAAYTVYLIHPWIVVPISWSFVLLVRLFRPQPAVTFWDRQYFKVVDVIQCPGEWMIWLGVAYTSLLSLLLVWPLAWLIKQIPWVRDVL